MVLETKNIKQQLSQLESIEERLEYLKNKYSDNEIFLLFENYDISKLDINRIYRYLEKYTKDTTTDPDKCDESEDDNSV